MRVVRRRWLQLQGRRLGLFKPRSRQYMAMAVVVGIFVIVGSVIIRSSARTEVIVQEAEAGIVSGMSADCALAGASGGQAVRFGYRPDCTATPVTPPPTPVPAGQLIGWSNVINGPGGAWHRLAKLADGAWLRVLTTFPSTGRSELHVYRSTDNARTWAKLSDVNDGNRLVDNGFLYVAPNGDLLLSGRNNVLGSSYKISQWRSTDDGRTWQREAELDSVTGGARGIWEPYYYSLPDGRTVAMWADETYAGFSQVLVQRVSSDNGKTWNAEKVVVSDGQNGRPGMAGVARMTNGQYIFTFEVCGTQGCTVYNKKSANGVDWPGGIGNRIPGQVCGPFVLSLADGRVVATACRVADGNNTTPISFSEDFGNSWKTNVPAFNDAGQYGEWPALYQTGPDEIASVNGGRIRFGSIAPKP